MTSRVEVNMRTIAIVSQKGGASKTTLAVHLATEASKSCVALILDTDPQATASRWGEWRGGGEPEPSHSQLLRDFMETAWIFCEMPSSAEDQMHALARVCDALEN
jgi:MinD-like ATPase involved in chromosome partitioning or flagellar assembly